MSIARATNRRTPQRAVARWSLAVAVSASLILTAGCAAQSAAPTAKATGQDGNPASLLPADVKASGVIKDAIYSNYPPLEYLDNGKLTGVYPEFADAVGKILGVKFENSAVPEFSTIIPGLSTGRYDTGFAHIGVTADRLQVVDILAVALVPTGFATNKASSVSIAKADDLCGHTAAVVAGGFYISQLQTLSDRCTAAGKSKITINTYPTSSDAVLAVKTQRVDFMSQTLDSLIYTTKQESELRLSKFTYGKTPIGVAFPKGSKLAPAVEAAFKELVKNGTYARILKKYGVEAIGVSKPSDIALNPTPAG